MPYCRTPGHPVGHSSNATYVSADQPFCIVSGTNDEQERLHATIKGVWGARTSGANIVSYNRDAFNSYGKKQGANAPIGKKAAFAYTTALNHLLGRNSKQRLHVGDATAVFWAEKASNLEQLLVDIFQEPPKEDPDRNTRVVESLFRPTSSGTYLTDGDETRFYILGLSPNIARLSVRFWVNSTVAEISRHISRHFEDLRIVHAGWEKEVLSCFVY